MASFAAMQQRSMLRQGAPCCSGAQSRPSPAVMCPVGPCSSSLQSSTRQHAGHRPQLRMLRAAKLGDMPLFADSSILGGPSSSEPSLNGKQSVKLEDVPLNSELGVDYAPLRDHLAAGDFRKADDETRLLLIKLAGPDAVKRNWVYFTEVKSIPIADLQTIDTLWRAASNGRFGYTVQREMFQQAGKRWARFFANIDWVVGENNVYRKWPAEFNYTADAPKGHLPLTNALRGTQLFQALLEHPAFEKKTVKSIEERSKEAGMGQMNF